MLILHWTIPERLIRYFWKRSCNSAGIWSISVWSSAGLCPYNSGSCTQPSDVVFWALGCFWYNTQAEQIITGYQKSGNIYVFRHLSYLCLYLPMIYISRFFVSLMDLPCRKGLYLWTGILSDSYLVCKSWTLLCHNAGIEMLRTGKSMDTQTVIAGPWAVYTGFCSVESFFVWPLFFFF